MSGASGAGVPSREALSREPAPADRANGVPGLRLAADVAIVGGGLAGSLAALAMRRRHPDLRIALIDATQVPRAQVWCCFAEDLRAAVEAATVSAARDDVMAEAWSLLEPLLAARWPEHRVRFPERERRLAGDYLAVDAARLATAVAGALGRPGDLVLRGQRATATSSTTVTLQGGARLDAALVIDARGPDPSRALEVGRAGFQKFVGQELILRRSQGGPLPSAALGTTPLLMDATLEQRDGFRFMYVLPFGEDRFLIEDTSFSDDAKLDVDERRAAILAYVNAHDLGVERLVREERGVLPMPWGEQAVAHGDGDEHAQGVATATGPVRLGFAGGLFHPATGYSLPYAVAAALTLAELSPSAGVAGARRALAPLARRAHAQNRFFHRLNWMLFRAVRPEARRGVFARFYGLPEPLVRRFYAGSLTPLDRARILVGRPPSGLRWPPREAVTSAVAGGAT